MRILITSFYMNGPSGTTIFVRDLALELLRQGQQPIVYSPHHGLVSQKLIESGISTISSLDELTNNPDIIHGHHMIETGQALSFFPNTPAIFFCHDHTGWHDCPPIHPHVYRYFGVSKLCVERLKQQQAPTDKTYIFHNFVDLQKFQQRPPLPDKPVRALVFSNYASAKTHLPAVEKACKKAGLELDVVGFGVSRQTNHPENLLGKYDLVFAKAKAAIEAMAVGSAVILCDFGGVGPLVTSKNFYSLRDLNFGYQSLAFPLLPDNILTQIELYNPYESAKVQELIRLNCGLEKSVRELINIYREVLEEHRQAANHLCVVRKPKYNVNPFRVKLMLAYLFLQNRVSDKYIQMLTKNCYIRKVSELIYRNIFRT